jgi:excisionase family DNA binding protein
MQSSTPTVVAAATTDRIPSDFLTVEEAARRLGIAKSALYEWLAHGVIAHHRVGRLIRIREADVVAYLARVRVEANPSPQYVRRP